MTHQERLSESILGVALYFDNSGKKEHRGQPPFLIQAFTKATTRDVPPPHRNKFREFYEKIIEELFIGSRGCLVAVLESGQATPSILQDGIFRPRAFDPGPLLLQYLQRRSPSVNQAPASHAHLVLNMLEMGGVTIVDTSGRALASHVFVSEVPNIDRRDDSTGRARSRAFIRMKSLIGRGIYAALYKS